MANKESPPVHQQPAGFFAIKVSYFARDNNKLFKRVT